MMRMNQHSSSSLATSALRAIVILGALVLSFELTRRAIPRYLPRDWAGAHELDAIEDWKAARLFFQGVSPYSPQGLAAIGETAMGHPPTTPFWYLPLAEFPKATAVQLSTFLVWVLLPIHGYLCAKALKFPFPVVTALLTASLLFASSFVKYHCDATQFSEPIAVLYVASWWFLRRGEDLRGGACLGLALTMKLFPGVMLVMLLLARRFRALFAATFSYLAVAAFMTRVYGFRAWPEFFAQQRGVSEQWLGCLSNSSLSGLILQLITPACVTQGHPSKTATLITLSSSLLLLAFSSWLSWSHFKAARAGTLRAVDLPFALFALLSVFLNAWVWDHYAVLVVQPLFILVATFARSGQLAFRSWCDERLTNQQLLAFGIAVAAGLAGVLLTLATLSQDSHRLVEMLNLWQQSPLPFYHGQLHFLQVENFAVWVIPILLCFLAFPLLRRAGAAEAAQRRERSLALAAPQRPTL